MQTLTKQTPWLAPIGTALAGALSLVYVRDTGGSSLIPPCGFHALTGLWCPGCGLTRGTRALMHGHLQQALGFNLFTPLVLGVFVYTWLGWAAPRLGGPRLPELADAPPKIWWSIGAAVLVFSVARNIPGPLAALAP